jgi:hypothetical protein
MQDNAYKPAAIYYPAIQFGGYNELERNGRMTI